MVFVSGLVWYYFSIESLFDLATFRSEIIGFRHLSSTTEGDIERGGITTFAVGTQLVSVI